MSDNIIPIDGTKWEPRTSVMNVLNPFMKTSVPNLSKYLFRLLPVLRKSASYRYLILLLLCENKDGLFFNPPTMEEAYTFGISYYEQRRALEDLTQKGILLQQQDKFAQKCIAIDHYRLRQLIELCDERVWSDGTNFSMTNWWVKRKTEPDYDYDFEEV